jgi:pimeloyl-ACP methyl ester carboxylesterase
MVRFATSVPEMLSLKRRPLVRWLLGLIAVVTVMIVAWTWWSESHPEQERELRILTRHYLETWFPEGMTLPDELQGLVPRSEVVSDQTPPRIILLHGLDEPGGIWDELVVALDEAGLNAWEFRYPNDQAIDRSADLLAEYWPEIGSDSPLVLIGHSMGGLVIRDFVGRWRHPVDQPAAVDGPEVDAVILVATPNQGSEWARLRIWLEIREMLADIPAGRFSLFAGLRDGTGAAKIDLRPDSRFLVELNERPWPDQIEIRMIGGQLTEPTPAMTASIAQLSSEFGANDLAKRIEELWSQTGEELGDGVVAVDALALPQASETLIVNASHRGLLVTTPLSEDQPPAIEPIVNWLKEWVEPADPGFDHSNRLDLNDGDQ